MIKRLKFTVLAIAVVSTIVIGIPLALASSLMRFDAQKNSVPVGVEDSTQSAIGRRSLIPAERFACTATGYNACTKNSDCCSGCCAAVGSGPKACSLQSYCK